MIKVSIYYVNVIKSKKKKILEYKVRLGTKDYFWNFERKNICYQIVFKYKIAHRKLKNNCETSCFYLTLAK